MTDIERLEGEIKGVSLYMATAFASLLSRSASGTDKPIETIDDVMNGLTRIVKFMQDNAQEKEKPVAGAASFIHGRLTDILKDTIGDAPLTDRSGWRR